MTKIFVIFGLIWGVSGRVLASAGWLCIEASSQKYGDRILACGIGIGKEESAARLKALDSAKSEFKAICSESDDCKGHEISVDPKRTDCEKMPEGYKCYRAVEFTVGGKRARESSEPEQQDATISSQAPSMVNPLVVKTTSTKPAKKIDKKTKSQITVEGIPFYTEWPNFFRTASCEGILNSVYWGQLEPLKDYKYGLRTPKYEYTVAQGDQVESLIKIDFEFSPQDTQERNDLKITCSDKVKPKDFKKNPEPELLTFKFDRCLKTHSTIDMETAYKEALAKKSNFWRKEVPGKNIICTSTGRYGDGVLGPNTEDKEALEYKCTNYPGALEGGESYMAMWGGRRRTVNLNPLNSNGGLPHITCDRSQAKCFMQVALFVLNKKIGEELYCFGSY